MSSYLFVVTTQISLYIFLLYPGWLSAIQTFVGSKIGDEKESGFEFLKEKSKNKMKTRK